MEKLIESLVIFNKYNIGEKFIFFDDRSLNIDINQSEISTQDFYKLKILGWTVDEDNNTFHYRGVN